MKAALIVMTIMGCDDSVTQCHYIDTVDRQWQTVALCDAQAESYMSRHQDENYPVIVAVCESANGTAAADTIEPSSGPELAGVPAGCDTPATIEDGDGKANLAARALTVVRKAIPDRASLRAVVTTPVRYAGDGYSWVVKRFVD